MKILLLTQWFEPEPTFKGIQFARELTARGHEVEVLTGFPNYPGGKLYPGYRVRPWMRESMQGIPVLRVALYPSHDKSPVGRVLNYVSFALSAALIGSALIRQPDIVYVYHPPATIGLAAVAIGAFRRVPFIFNIHDLWPDTVAQSGMMQGGGAIALIGRFCQFIYRRARHIVVVSPGFKQQLVLRGVPAGKVDVIYNWCDEATIAPVAPDPQLAAELGLAGRFNVMFAGTMGTAQALDAVLNAAALCLAPLPDVQFVFVGGGVDRDRLKNKAALQGLSNVMFLDRQPMSAMGALLEIADVLLVHLKDHPLFKITIPSKAQANMAAGKPILMAVRGDAADLVTKSGCGLLCEPENPQSIADAVAQFHAMSPDERREMGEAGRRYYFSELGMKAGCTKFEAIFAAVA